MASHEENRERQALGVMLQSGFFGLTFAFYFSLGMHSVVARVVGLTLGSLSSSAPFRALAFGMCGLVTGLWCSFLKHSPSPKGVHARAGLVLVTGVGVLLLLIATDAWLAYMRVLWGGAGVLAAVKAVVAAIDTWSWHDVLVVTPLAAAPSGIAAALSMGRGRILEHALACATILCGVGLAIAVENICTGMATPEHTILHVVASGVVRSISIILVPGALVSLSLIAASASARWVGGQGY